MVKSNTTISVEADVLVAAKNKAALLDTSVSELCNDFLTTFTQGEAVDKPQEELLQLKKVAEKELLDSKNRILALDKEIDSLETKKDSEAKEARKAEVKALMAKAKKKREEKGERKDLGLWK